WGVRLLAQCKDSIFKAITNNVKFRLLVGYDSLDDESLLRMPEDINVKIGDIRSSRIIIDSASMILMDSKNGKAALFSSLDVIGVSYLRHFEEDWNHAIQVKLPKNSDTTIALKSTRLVRVMNEYLTYDDCAIQGTYSHTDKLQSILNSAGNIGVKLLGEPL